MAGENDQPQHPMITIQRVCVHGLVPLPTGDGAVQGCPRVGLTAPGRKGRRAAVQPTTVAARSNCHWARRLIP